MTVFSGKQVVPVNYEAEVSQQLLEACLSSDLRSALDCISDPCLDVNFVGAVCLKSRRSEVVLRDESAGEVRVEYEEFKTDVTALFLAVHSGNVDLVRNLLSIGADVNQKLFRGFATTAAVREGHLEILEILLKAGASQPACEEALLEASCHGRARVTEVLMGSDIIRPHVAVHALVTASCRGFADVVDTLMKCGVDFNATDRLLLLSSKPSLHTNVDCSALVAAVVTRQVDVVRMLLKAGAKTDVNVRLGAWSWDTTTGEEFRVGAGLADPYGITWCAVEYFESTGTVLRMLLQHYNFSPNNTHHGRTLLHYAILCGNEGAVRVLLGCGADVEAQVKTVKTVFRPIHMAARLALPAVLKLLIQSSCDLNSRTDSGDTALMICAKYRHEECLKVLAMAGADFGLVNNAGQSALSIAATNRWFLGFQQAVLEAIKSGNVPVSSNVSVFCPLFFVSQAGDAEALQVLIKSTCMKEVVDLDYQDENGYSAVMFAALHGRVEAFRLLVQAGADVKLQNKSGETAISLSELNQNRDLFEKVMLDHALEKGNRSAGGFHALHCAARHGDIVAAKLLITSRGYDVNVPDGDGYTPLMLAAKGGHKAMCQFLIVSCGADCEWKNGRGETAVSLARGGGVEDVILDELARKLVVRGCYVKKHTKSGAGVVHGKEMRMVAGKGVLSWGKSSRRNVVCRDAEVGGSGEFRKKRERKGRDGEDSGLFRVMTTKNREVHFVCDGGREMAELWVRGIKLVTRDAICC